MNVGFSKKKITPALGTLMAGHPGIKRANGIRDDLYVRVAVIDNLDAKVIFAALDILFLDIESVNYIKQEVCKQVNINMDSIFISATLTHSGPMTTYRKFGIANLCRKKQ